MKRSFQWQPRPRALTLAACDKPRTNSAYNNSGKSATPLMPADPPPALTAAPDAAATPASPAQSAVTTASATSDTASPSTPPMPADQAKSEAPK